MGITETAIIYTILGAVVAAAFRLAHGGSAGPITQTGLFALRTVCWPFFAPMLLASGDASSNSARRAPPPAASQTPRVDEAEQRMLGALDSLEGVAGDLFEPQRRRVEELTASLRTMQARLGEMDALLATTEFDEDRAQHTLEAILADNGERNEERAESVRARLRNIGRLKKMRARLNAEFERAILKVDEMSSQMLLLRFADHPEREVSELIGDIAATVEGLTEGLSYA